MKAKVVTFTHKAELRAWFDLRGDEDRAIIYSEQERLPNNTVRYEAVVITRQGTQRIPERASTVVKNFIERYTGTLGITTAMALGVGLKVENTTGIVSIGTMGPTVATRIIEYLRQSRGPHNMASIAKAIGGGYNGVASVLSVLTKADKVIRINRGLYAHPDYNQEVSLLARNDEAGKADIQAPFAASQPIKPAVPPLVVSGGRESDQDVAAILGSLAVQYQSSELFQMALRVSAILGGEELPTVELEPAPEVKLVPLQQIELSARQQLFGNFLADKKDRDVTSRELVETVLGSQFAPGKRQMSRFDMIPHGWYRTIESGLPVWRHESRRRHYHRVLG
jgi:hypothetical protein